jgi:hypothetical protein
LWSAAITGTKQFYHGGLGTGASFAPNLNSSHLSQYCDWELFAAVSQMLRHERIRAVHEDLDELLITKKADRLIITGKSLIT